jgi:hypothetical protein
VRDATAVFVMSLKPVSCVAQSPRWRDQARVVLGCKYYSLRSEKAYLYWVKFLRYGSVAKARYRRAF